MRNILAKLLIGVAIAAALAFGAENNFLGTWKLNLEKSKYNPGPPPKSLTEIIEAAEGGMKVTGTGEGPDGTPIDSIAIKQVDANTHTFTTKKDGKVFSRGQAKISGNTLTITSQGTDAKGKSFNSTAVYDRE